MQKLETTSKTELVLVEGDITSLEFDAIVNPANENLRLWVGLAGAIRFKGGEEIKKECDKIGAISVGGAVPTCAGNLNARYIIHAVSPRAGEGEEEIKLKNATINSLLLAEEHDLKTLFSLQ